jgi:hypothetical protein
MSEPNLPQLNEEIILLENLSDEVNELLTAREERPEEFATYLVGSELQAIIDEQGSLDSARTRIEQRRDYLKEHKPEIYESVLESMGRK